MQQKLLVRSKRNPLFDSNFDYTMTVFDSDEDDDPDLQAFGKWYEVYLRTRLFVNSNYF